MKRIATAALASLAALLLAAATAQAAAPSLGAVSATDIQGVSALLKGSVDPEGLSTTYWFEYGTASGFSGAAKTAVQSAGSGTDPHPARVAISGLIPSTTYYYRLVASNSSGTTTGTSGAGSAGSFNTTSGFGFLSGTAGFSANAFADGGAPGVSIASSSHPYQLDFGINLRAGGEFEDQSGVQFPDGDIRDLQIKMPPGLIFNPNALLKCSSDLFHTPRVSPFETSRSGESCPDKSQVGAVEVKTSLAGGESRRFGLFNLDPPAGTPAQLGFAPYGRPVALDVGMNQLADGSYVLTLEAQNMPQSLDLSGIDLNIWGTPWAASHDDQRGNCLNESEPDFGWCKASVGEPAAYPPLAFVTMPSPCLSSLDFTAAATAWQQPAQVTAGAMSRDTQGQAVKLGSCSSNPFSPSPEGFLTTKKASSPSGYAFRLHGTTGGLTDPASRADAATRTAAVSLPAGVSVNPSVGAGLGTCSPAQYAAETVFNGQGNGCPSASKIGDFSVKSPLFDGFFEGSIYLASPYDNPFGTLVAVYLVAKHEDRGLMIKVPGRVDPNPVDGTVTATFDGLPQIPYTDLEVNFRTSQRSFLISPPGCGSANTQIQMAPWSGGTAANATTTSPIETGIGAGPCPSGTPPFKPGVIAGGVNSNVNSYTPYFVHISRQDTEQEITGYSLVLPEGITGKLAGIPFCSDAAIEAARSRSGVAEAASPSCPEASLIGHVLTGYGVGDALTYTNGKIYMAGPYNGQPLSIVVINPATVGPFDLGTVVIRSAFSVNEHTAQLQIDKSASDSIPHILGGIPLHLRDVRIYMDRPQFTHNPSSCAPSQLVSTLSGAGANFTTTADDSAASVSEHFQLLNCRTLGFQPKLGVQLRGGTKRNGHPQLTATFAARGPGDSNLKEISVTIPHQEFLAQDHIRGICTKAQFAAQKCPADSIYGTAAAYTPLFDAPLTGNVYLRSAPGRQLPDLVADLYSGAVRIVLEGEIGPGRKGGIQTFFDNLPDEPVDRFTMTLFGGKRGLLVNSADICAKPPVSDVEAQGQTNLGYVFTTRLRGQCGKAKHKKKAHHKRHHKGGRR